MALSKFNKFLIWRWLAEQTSVWSTIIRMKWMIDMKKITKDFKQNEKDLIYYYANRKNLLIKQTYKFKNIANKLIFY